MHVRILQFFHVPSLCQLVTATCQTWSGFSMQLLLNLRGTVQELSLPGVLARNLESFHLSIESESTCLSCTIKGPSDPEQLSCAQVSEVTSSTRRPSLRTDFRLVCLFLSYQFICMNEPLNHCLFRTCEIHWLRDKSFSSVPTAFWGSGG